MPKLALTGGAYQARSLIANAQRCVNLYPEKNPEDAPFPYTYYPTPGLTLAAAPPSAGVARGLYRTSNGFLVEAVGTSVYLVSSTYTRRLIGTVADRGTPVSMADNGLALVLVDGSTTGYAMDLTGNMNTATLAPIADPNFLGADFVAYVDTYFVFNQPGTRFFYPSLSNVTYGLLVQGGIVTAAISNAGGGYYVKYPDISKAALPVQLMGYEAAPLVNITGTGAGALVNITVSGTTANNDGIIASVALSSVGEGYAVGDQLTAALGGQIVTLVVQTAGTGYTTTAGSNVYLYGGTGDLAAATIVVSGGQVTSASVFNRGWFYSVNDILSFTADDGLGTGATLRVSAVSNFGSGFVYTVTAAAAAAFNSLNIAGKVGNSDLLAGIAVVHREIWLIGELTTEVWYNTGAADFPFGIMPGVFIEHGCVAKYSIATQDVSVFWLSQDKQGTSIVVMGAGYTAKRVSTHAIETAISRYATINDAVGHTYQQGGHIFYVLNFPTADATWVYDVGADLWHQRASTQPTTEPLHRHIAQFSAFAYGKNFTQDAATGQLYFYDLTQFTDNGATVPRIRGFPHIQNDGKRVSYSGFTADIEVGTPLTGSTPAPLQVMWLRWSNDRGVTFGSPVEQTIGLNGEYRNSVQWGRLGMGRDRVFEVGWSCSVKAALNGAFVQMEGGDS